VTADPLALDAELDRATRRLLDRVDTLDEKMVHGPSRLPGWTRGHVLTHIARNADGMLNLLASARTGEYIPQYPSRQVRDEQIEAGARRSPAEHLLDLRESAARFAGALDAMPPQAWAATVRVADGERLAATLVWVRLREVEVHHVDLDAGYSPADWPEAFSHRLLHEAVADLSGRTGVPAVLLHPDGAGHPLQLGVTPAGSSGDALTAAPPPGGTRAPDSPLAVGGPIHALAGWLTGRGGTDQLAVHPDGPLPTLPSWR
jgi:maleylpyruvate isomerase